MNQIFLANIVGLIVLIGLSRFGVNHPGVAPVQVMLVGAAPVQVPAIQATIYSAKNCGPCIRYEKAVKAEMPKDGWIVKALSDKDAKSAHIRFTIDEKELAKQKVEATPTTIVVRVSDGKVLRRIEGELTPQHLAEVINDEAKKLK